MLFYQIKQRSVSTYAKVRLHLEAKMDFGKPFLKPSFRFLARLRQSSLSAIVFLIKYRIIYIPQSKFSFASRCKPIKCRVSLFSHVRKVIQYVQSEAAYHVWAVRQLKSGRRLAKLKSFSQLLIPTLTLKLNRLSSKNTKLISLVYRSSGEEYVETIETPRIRKRKQSWIYESRKQNVRTSCKNFLKPPFFSVYSPNCKYQQIFCYFRAMRWLVFWISDDAK